MTVIYLNNNTSYLYPDVTNTVMAQRKRSTPEHEESSDGSSIRIKTENENWRGKNDPTERRRIQNRLNQRAFRQRRRTGTSPPQTRATPTSSPDRSQDELSQTVTARESPAPPIRLSTSPPGLRPSATWDELARTINGNLMEAVAINARTLHLDEAAVRQGERMRTPGQRASVPIALGPVPLQHQISHDLLYDTIPHPRIRQNIMAAIISGRLDQAALSSCIRASGALVFWQGTWQRRGLVVWGDASCISSWELTEGFVRTFGFLLEGCDDFLAATNTWRAMRGEAPITL